MFSEEAHIMEMPREGDYIAIQSYKHNGTLHRNWRDTMVVILLLALMIEL